jgi:hypothetical protein
MLYKVQARYKEDRAGEFFQKLTDGTIAIQEPDGAEIVASMQQARIIEDGMIRWYETCYCDTPLKHERETVYNFYLTDITTELADFKKELEGESFWGYLQSKEA